jgi:PAS domain S-box-containing protein
MSKGDAKEMAGQRASGRHGREKSSSVPTSAITREFRCQAPTPASGSNIRQAGESQGVKIITVRGGNALPWAQRWGVAIHPDDLPKLEAAWHAHLPTAEPLQLEQRMRRADAEYRWHLARRVPHRNEKGEVTGWYGVAHDIEDQRRAQQALHRSERELRDLIETMPAMAVAALPDGSPTFVNRRWTEYTGLSAEDTVGSGWKTAMHPEDFVRWLNLWRVCLVTGQPFEDEARFRRASDGEYRWFWTRGVPLRDEQGKIAGWYGLGLDIQSNSVRDCASWSGRPNESFR